jgi:hypothetical protein
MSSPGWSTVRQNRNGFVVAFSMGKFKFSHHGQVKFLTIDVFIVIFNIQRTGCKKWMLLTFWEKKPFPQTLCIIYLCSLFEIQIVRIKLLLVQLGLFFIKINLALYENAGPVYILLK